MVIINLNNYMSVHKFEAFIKKNSIYPYNSLHTKLLNKDDNQELNTNDFYFFIHEI